ncbi:hypothetical protein Vretifemale_1776 [Volvox reticuliferus]|nr:hypothetical protein Vretifemale_1776 [Volvox reticuliferus]
MALTASAVNLSGIPQVFPGTMLRVEEGQVCAVLCAVEDELYCGPMASGPCGEQQIQHHLPSRGTLRLSPEQGGGSNTTLNAVPALTSGRTEVVGVSRADKEVERERMQQQQEAAEDYEDDFVDGAATATPYDGSSSNGDETETFSELSDPGGTEVVFVREGVAVWPGARAERILGRLSLVKQCNVLFMAWLPYSRGILQEDGTFQVTKAEAAAPPPSSSPSPSGMTGGTCGAGASSSWGSRGPAGNGGGGHSSGGTGGHTDAAAGAHAPAPGRDRTLYAVHPIPLSEVKALRRRSPPLGLGCPSLVVVLTSGVTLPPLYFQKGGVKALISTLKQHVFLLKSADDPHTYLVNDTADPLSRSLSALQLSDVLIGGPPPGASATFKPGEGVVALAPDKVSPSSPLAPWAPAAWATPTIGLGLVAAAGLGGGSGRSGNGNGGLAGAGGVMGMGLGLGLDLGSAVSWSWADQPVLAAAAVGKSTTARKTGLAVTDPSGFEAVGGSSSDGHNGGNNDAMDDGEDGIGEAVRGGAGRQANAWAYGIVEAINRFVQNVRGTASGWIGALDDLEEQDGDLSNNYYATLPDGEVEPQPSVDSTALSPQCATVAANQHEGHGTGGSLKVAAVTTPLAWPPPPVVGRSASSAADGSTAAEVNTAVGEFELLDGGGCWGEAAAHPHCRRRARPPPLGPEEWAAMFDADGRLVVEAALRDRVCLSGCAPELRREVWKHLLGMYPCGSTAAQRAETAKKWQDDYRTLRQQWQSMVPAQEARCGSWRCYRAAVDKDVRRTDRTHPFFAREGCLGLRALRNVLLTHVVFDRDLGYCQGMSDLAAPLLVIMRDEAEAFWAFAALMERMAGNFHTDLLGMTLQLAALRRLVQLVDPPLHAYFERRDCLSYYFAFRWLLILFKREFK